MVFVESIAILLASSCLSPCQGIRDVPKLKTIFGPEAQHADYVVVIDRSGSMKRYWSEVIHGISDFVASLPDKDHISVILFDREATNTQVLPRTLNSQSRKDLMKELTRLPPPSGSSNQQYTDFGKALSALSGELGRPGANRLQFVFMFSDFEHDPAPDSPYKSHDPQNRAWQGLAVRYQRVISDKLDENFALMLPLSANVGRDLALVRKVVGKVEVVPINDPQTLQEWFNRRREEIVRDKLRVLVSADIKRGWQFGVEARTFSDLITVKSNLQELDLTASVKNISSSGLRGRVEQGLIDVQPGKVARVGELSPDGLVGWLTWLVTLRHVVNANPIRVDGYVEIQPADEIGPDLAIDPNALLAPGGKLGVPLTYGAPAWFQILILLLLLVLIVAMWQTWLAPVMPISRMFRRVILHGPSHGEELKIVSDRRSAITIGNSSGSDLLSRLETPIFSFRLVSRKPGFFRLRPKRGIYVHCTGGTVYYRSRRFDGRTRRWSEQDVPLPIIEAHSVPLTFQTKLSVKAQGEEVIIRMGN